MCVRWSTSVRPAPVWFRSVCAVSRSIGSKSTS
ncbi:Uncharacterised protein [Bordetella pertussis]|nr:Uncharacterised protein [Bordetella pertussis]